MDKSVLRIKAQQATSVEVNEGPTTPAVTIKLAVGEKLVVNMERVVLVKFNATHMYNNESHADGEVT